MDKKIIIGNVFKEQLNRFGDNGNIFPLITGLEERNIPYEVREYTLNEELLLEDIDILIIGNGDSRGKRLILDYLKDYKDKLKEFIEKDKVLFATGTSYYFLGDFWEKKEEKLPGLGLFDLTVEELEDESLEEVILESNLEGKKTFITGFLENNEIENHSYEFLGKIIKGSNLRNEGLIYKHVIGTGLLGPVLVYNRDLCDLLLKWSSEKKFPGRFKNIKNPLESKYKRKVLGLKNV